MTEEAKTPEEQQFTTCPCCGKPTLSRPVEIKGALLDHYIACMLTNVPFSHTYPIYNGKVEVTVEQLTKEALFLVEEASSMLSLIADRAPELKTAADDATSHIKMYCGINSIVIRSGSDISSISPSGAILAACHELKDKKAAVIADKLTKEELESLVHDILAQVTDKESISSLPSMLLSNVLDIHSRLYVMLMEAGLDSNFWAGIELA